MKSECKMMKTPTVKLLVSGIIPTLLVMLFVNLVPLPAAEEELMTAISSWTETVDLQPDGSARVTVQIGFERAAPGPLQLPCSFGKLSSPVLEIKGPANGRVEKKAGVNLLSLELTASPSPDQPLTITYLATGVFEPDQAVKTDFGNIETKYQFVNTVLVPISSFTGVVLLPPGLVVNNVDSYLPKLKKEDPNDPYTFDLFEGRRRMTIVVNTVKPGDRVMLAWRMKSTTHSPWFIFGIVLVGLGWLLAFRDIITPPAQVAVEKKP